MATLKKKFIFWWGIAAKNLLSPSRDATFGVGKQSIVVFTPCPVAIFYPDLVKKSILLLCPKHFLDDMTRSFSVGSFGHLR